MKIIILSFLFILCGCSSIEYVDKPYMPDIPASFLQECPTMTQLYEPSVSALISITIDNASKYKWCKANNDGLVEIIKKQQKIINGDKK